MRSVEHEPIMGVCRRSPQLDLGAELLVCQRGNTQSLLYIFIQEGPKVKALSDSSPTYLRQTASYSLGPNFTLGDHCKLNKSYQNLLLDTY